MPMSFVRRFAETNIFQLAANALQLVVSIVIARSLGVAGKGAYAAATALLEVIVYIALFGINNGILYVAAKSADHARRTATLTVFFTAVNGAFAAALMALLAWSNAPISRNVNPQYLLILAPLALISIGVSYFSFLAISREHVTAYNILNVLVPVLQLVGLLALLAVVRSISVKHALWVLVTTNAIILALYVFIGATRIGFARIIDLGLARTILVVGFRSYIVALLGYIVLRSDIIILNMLKGNYQVGLYSTATALAFKLLLVSSSVTVLLSPRMIRDLEGSLEFQLKVARVLSFLIVLILIATDILYVPAVYVLYGRSFVPSWQPYFILNIGMFFLTLYSAFGPYYIARGIPSAAIAAAFVAAASNVILNFMLIPDLGYNGAALASSISYFLAFAIYAWDLRRNQGVSVSSILIPRAEELAELKNRILAAITR